MSLPPADATDKLLRYEAHLDRQLYRAMDQLERLQRQRRGENLPRLSISTWVRGVRPFCETKPRSHLFLSWLGETKPILYPIPNNADSSLKVDPKVGGMGKRRHMSMHYDYSNVHPPAGCSRGTARMQRPLLSGLEGLPPGRPTVESFCHGEPVCCSWAVPRALTLALPACGMAGPGGIWRDGLCNKLH